MDWSVKVVQLLFQNLYASWHRVQELRMKVFANKVTLFILITAD